MSGFYSSPEWLAVRHQALARDRWRCVLCGASVSARGAARVDHIRPRRQFPELALSLANLRSLCVACDAKRHAEKGRAPAMAALVGADASGWPTAAAHPWNAPRRLLRGDNRGGDS